MLKFEIKKWIKAVGQKEEERINEILAEIDILDKKKGIMTCQCR